MVETVVVIFVTLLLLLGVIQFGLIYNAKTTLNYAAFEAARAGALNYADKAAIEYALARGLAPLFTSVSTADGPLTKVKKVQNARDEVLDEIRAGEFACIERLNPPDSSFSHYAVNDPTGNFPGEDLIPNDHLHYRKAVPTGGLSIQDANLLKLRITYCYPMYVPVISTTIKRLMGLTTESTSLVATGQTGATHATLTPKGSFQSNCYSKDRFPIVAQAIVRMQTPIKNDLFPPSCD
jgi:hypothetical protein